MCTASNSSGVWPSVPVSTRTQRAHASAPAASSIRTILAQRQLGGLLSVAIALCSGVQSPWSRMFTRAPASSSSFAASSAPSTSPACATNISGVRPPSKRLFGSAPSASSSRSSHVVGTRGSALGPSKSPEQYP